VKTKLLVTLAVGVLALGACGGGSAVTMDTGTAGPEATSEPEATAAAEATAPPDNGAAVDACALLTVDEVKGVTGADTKAEVESTSGWGDWVAGQCWWNSADLSTRFSIDVGTPASIAKSSSPTTKEQMELSRLVQKSFGEVKDIPGLGDDAFYGSGTVLAVKNGSMLQLFTLNMDQEKATELAKLALARL
jgi:hypothetical protein